LRGAVLCGANLTFTQFQEANLAEANFGGTQPATLSGADFRKAYLPSASFDGCFFSGTKLEGASLLNSGIWKANLEEIDWGNYTIGEETRPEELDFAFHAARCYYKQLKIWYTNKNLYDIAAKFHYREREAEKKQYKLLSKNWHHRLAREIARLVFGYGENWERVLVWIALIIFGFAIAFNLHAGMNFLYSLYFSLISFTALGYGSWVDIRPQGWVQALGAFESFIGVFMMALLLVTIFRKWAR
jgi:hypothetical protein